MLRCREQSVNNSEDRPAPASSLPGLLHGVHSESQQPIEGLLSAGTRGSGGSDQSTSLLSAFPKHASAFLPVEPSTSQQQQKGSQLTPALLLDGSQSLPTELSVEDISVDGSAPATGSVAPSSSAQLLPRRASSSKLAGLDAQDLIERRKQRRLEKNRATAALSRERKRAQAQMLEARNKVLESEISHLKATVQSRDAEVAWLKDQLASLSKHPSNNNEATARAPASASEPEPAALSDIALLLAVSRQSKGLLAPNT